MNPNRKKLKEMQQKKWWSYALLAAGIFVFTEGCTLIKTNTEYALPAVFFSLLMHSYSMKDLGKRLFKIEPANIANIAMVLVLVIVASLSYFKEINLAVIFILNLSAILIYLIVSAISAKLFKKHQ